MKIKYIIWILCLAFSSQAFSNGIEESAKEHENLPIVQELGGFLTGQMLSEETMMVYFNMSQDEFLELVQSAPATAIDIEFVKRSHAQDVFETISQVTLDGFDSGFNIESWVFQIEDINHVNWEYLARIEYPAQGNICAELVLIPIVEPDPIVEEDEVLPISLPDYECEEDYTYSNISNHNPLSEAGNGDVFIIGGIPILLDEVTGGNGSFSGTGTVPLPFGNKTVKVEFSNILVNDENVVYEGSVSAISDDPANYPDFNPDTGPLNIGGDICLPPPVIPGYDSTGINQVTGLDDWGFDPETGLNSETGTEYDVNGYDANGNHVDTNGPYNEQGCDREGLDQNQQPCDPSGGANPEAEQYAEENANELRTQFMTLAAQIQSDLSAELAALNCDDIKTEMQNLVGILGFDSDFIFGVENQYINENMHLEFNEAPQRMILDADRNANVVLLEEKHIELYHCDKQRYKLNALLAAINNLINENSITAIIIEKIENWTEYQFNLYTNDPEKLEEWILNQIELLMWTNSDLSDDYVITGQNPPTTPLLNSPNTFKSIFEINQDARYAGAIASIDGLSVYDNSVSLDELAAYFLNGHQMINGVDRAFFLEELAKKQSAAIFFEERDDLMPIKVENTIGNKTYTIYLDGIVLTPTGAIVNAYIIITDPETGNKFVLRALNASFGPTGLHTGSRLHLASDVEIRLNNAAMLTLKGTEDTYVAWDCAGFSSMGIDSEIEFCRNFITPLDATTLEPLADSIRYKLSFSVPEISSWLEFYIILDAPPFAVTQYPDIKWSLTNMVLDFSSEETPQFTPLEGYASPFWKGSTMSPLWKGFFVDQLTATLPNSFGNGSEPIVVSANKILIDGFGFTGGVTVENILNLESGNMAGWPMSIEDFELRILNNQFAGAGIGGQIKVPVFEEAMDYEAVMYPGDEISFSVSPAANLTMDMFLAQVEIYQNSKIKISKIDGEFLAVATLNGKLLVNTDNSDSPSPITVQIPEITFQGFRVSNQAPYFDPGNWGIGEEISVDLKLGGFGLNISDIAPYDAGEARAGIGFDISVDLVKALGISAAGGFGIEGVMETNDSQQKWVFDKVIVNEFGVNASFPGADIKGVISWYGNGATPDPVWGKGFRGLIGVKFKGFELELKAAAQFGKKDDYKYFFVDALADLGAGIGTGALQLTGFGGGISYHMDVSQESVALFNEDGAFVLPPLGATLSGTSYSPNPDRGLGLKATAVISTAKKDIFNGTVSLIFLFNDGNGLNSISIQGTGQFLQDLNFDIAPDFTPNAATPPSVSGAAMTAFINLTFNFDEPSFHGALNVFLNAGNIQGAGAGGKMVDAELHFDPTQWYIYIGRPEEGRRCGIILDVPIIGSLEATSYMDIGTNVPPMAQLPSNVREIAYLVNDNASLRSSGAGFVFGAALNFTIGARIAGIITTELSAGAGFDMMLRKYNGLSCQGSTDPVGINGWYASGQMYAYVHGQLKVFGINILSAGLAAVLQARLPNPFWAQATVGVRVKILFKTVTKSLKLELGNNCILVSDDPNDEVGIEVISHLEPFEGAENVSTHGSLKAYFNIALNKSYQIADFNGNNQEFTVLLESTTLTSSQGFQIAHTIEIENEGGIIKVVPNSTFPANDEITFQVIVNIHKNGNFLAEEMKSITFQTGEDATFIPIGNVVASYPVNGMANFYKNEYNRNEGYLKLKTGQANLLLNIPSNKKQYIRFTSSSGEMHCENYSYSSIAKELTFPMNPSQFESGELYKMEIVQVTEGGRATSCDPGESYTPFTGNTPDLRNTEAGAGGPSNTATAAPIGIIPDIILYSLYFRVSEYDTFVDKIEDITASNNAADLSFSLNTYEGFDALETSDNIQNGSLIEFKVDLNNQWMNEQVVPSFQDLADYFYTADVTFEDLESETGIRGIDNGLTITQSTYLSGSFNMNNTSQELGYWVPESANQLFDDATLAAENVIVNVYEDCYYNPVYVDCAEMGSTLTELTSGFDDIFPGTYPVTVKYKLPGKAVTSIRTINFIKN